MIKEGTGLFTDRGPVTPFVGKYAARTASVFEHARLRWAEAGLSDAPYRLMFVEYEITTKCNDTCASCGMGAQSMRDGMTMTDAQIASLTEQCAAAGVPAVGITGGEPFAVMRPLKYAIRAARERGVDVAKLTTNGWWGSTNRCSPTFDALVSAGLLDNELMVPLLMVSIGEQTTPLEFVARIIHEVVTRFDERQLTVAVSSLADPATRKHRVYQLMNIYEQKYGPFPHDRVHSTMRVYLPNDRLTAQAEIQRPGHTTLARWMDRCFDCFAPTVGAYLLPHALVKQDGRFYSCAAFNVPEKLAFGNVFDEPLIDILAKVNSSAYVRKVRAGGGLKSLHDVVPSSVTRTVTCDSFCGSCALLIDEFERRTGADESSHVPPQSKPLPLIPMASLWSKRGGSEETAS